jgi:N-acyl-D-amino-acid deacylase
MPILTLVDARRRGFEIDEENLQAQLEHTAAHLERGRGAYAEGRGQGGQADTAGWALWALAAAEHSPDEATEAVAHYLIDKDHHLGRWRAAGRGRRPTQGSDYTTTYLAIYGLRTFATPEQEARSSDRISSAQKWIVDSKPNDTEDLVFRLRALYELSVDDKMLETAASDLLRMQRDDGGWAQTPASLSDAYATGTVLTALVETGQLPIDSTTYTRGVAYLLKSQRSDGSWRVETRAEPIQTYFESGFPHGKDQFISMAATCWATITLLKCCTEVPTGQ